MKIGSVEITPCEEILVLPRPGEDLVIIAHSVTTMDEFDTLCPEPQPPGIRTKDGFRPDKEDEGYKELVAHHAAQRTHFMVINSLIPSEIEWDNVTLDDPVTWKNWSEELKEAGLSDIECGRILKCVLSANSLDDEKIDAARDSFLLGRLQ